MMFKIRLHRFQKVKDIIPRVDNVEEEGGGVGEDNEKLGIIF